MSIGDQVGVGVGTSLGIVLIGTIIGVVVYVAARRSRSNQSEARSDVDGKVMPVKNPVVDKVHVGEPDVASENGSSGENTPAVTVA